MWFLLVLFPFQPKLKAKPLTWSAAGFGISQIPNTSSFVPRGRRFNNQGQKTKTLWGRESFLALTVTVGRAGAAGCRDASHPACCFLTGYLGSTLARRKSWQPRPARITSLSFLNFTNISAGFPCSVYSLELHDSVWLFVCVTKCVCTCVHLACRLFSTVSLIFTEPPTVKLYDNRNWLKTQVRRKSWVFRLGITGYLRLWHSLASKIHNQLVENSACSTTGANNKSSGEIYLWSASNK